MRANRRWNGWAFIAFPLLILTVFSLLPAIGGALLSFFSWDGSGLPRWVGWSNFAALLRDDRAWSALRNTIIFVATTTPVTVLGGFALASVLAAPWFRARTLIRTLFFLPTVVSIVAIGVAWRWLLDDTGGLIPELCRALGVRSMPNLLQDGAWPLVSIIVIQVWRGVGFCMVLYLAAIAGLNPSLTEAAEIDGASRWNVLRHVTWPHVRPITAFLLITGMIGALQVFDVVFAVTGDSPTRTTTVLNYVVFREFQQSRLGYASAVGVVILLLTAGVTLIQLRHASVRA